MPVVFILYDFHHHHHHLTTRPVLGVTGRW